MKNSSNGSQDANDRSISETETDNPEIKKDAQQALEILPAKDTQESLEVSSEKNIEDDGNIELEGDLDVSPTVEFLETMRHLSYTNYTTVTYSRSIFFPDYTSFNKFLNFRNQKTMLNIVLF